MVLVYVPDVGDRRLASHLKLTEGSRGLELDWPERDGEGSRQCEQLAGVEHHNPHVWHSAWVTAPNNQHAVSF